MTITTIYKCDKCGNEQPTREQFWVIGVAVRHEGNYGSRTMDIQGERQMHVCRPCLESFGIYAKEKPQEPETPVTIETLMRQIIELASS